MAATTATTAAHVPNVFGIPLTRENMITAGVGVLLAITSNQIFGKCVVYFCHSLPPSALRLGCVGLVGFMEGAVPLIVATTVLVYMNRRPERQHQQ